MNSPLKHPSQLQSAPGPAEAGQPLRGCRKVARPSLLERLALALLLAGLLAGCGPGVGGSGTGATEDPLQQFGATALPVCGNPLAPQLASCVRGQPLSYADSSPLPRVTAQLLDSHLELQAHCTGLKFSGDWAAVGDQPPRFYGTVTSGTGTTLASAVTVPAGANGLQVELRDAAGLKLLGPVTLFPATAGAALANCN